MNGGECGSVVAHMCCGSAVHNPVTVAVEGRGGVEGVTDEIGKGGYGLSRSKSFKYNSGSRLGMGDESMMLAKAEVALAIKVAPDFGLPRREGWFFGAMFTPRWVTDNSPATVAAVAIFATHTASRLVAGLARVSRKSH